MGDMEECARVWSKGQAALRINEADGTGLKGELSRNLPLLLCVIRNSYAGAKKCSYQATNRCLYILALADWMPLEKLLNSGMLQYAFSPGSFILQRIWPCINRTCQKWHLYCSWSSPTPLFLSNTRFTRMIRWIPSNYCFTKVKSKCHKWYYISPQLKRPIIRIYVLTYLVQF